MKIDKETIRQRALELIALGDAGVGGRLAREVGVSRQVANGYLQGLLRDGLIDAEGSTRARVYTLTTLFKQQANLPREGLEEDRVWREQLAEPLSDLPDNVRDIWHYAATEMINNAIDHSGAEQVLVGLERNALFTEVRVEDDGEGIFLKIQRALALYDPREAILELVKGKLTTAPANHSGEGIFFTSKMVDSFQIVSSGLHFRHDAGTFDRLLEDPGMRPGTLVLMRLLNQSERTSKSVFDAFADPEDFTFSRTVVPLRLAQHEGERLVSRSQAKRVTHGFERFQRVVLDFNGISEIGQAFADELFRVFARAHPEIRLVPENTSEAVDQMIRRAVNTPERRQ